MTVANNNYEIVPDDLLSSQTTRHVEARIDCKRRDKMRILYIGYNCSPNEEYVQRLRMAGHYVFWVGQGPTNDASRQTGNILYQGIIDALEAGDDKGLNVMLEQLKRFSEGLKVRPELDLIQIEGHARVYEGPMGLVPVTTIERRFRDLLGLIGEDMDSIGMNFDVVFHTANWIDFTDLEKSPIPYVYFASEPFYPIVPKCAWEVVTPTRVYTDYLQAQHGGRYKKYHVLPWAFRDQMRYVSNETMLKAGPDPATKKSNFFLAKNRPVGCAWAGKINGYKFYEKRKQFVLKMEELLGDAFEGHWVTGRLLVNEEIGEKRLEAERGRGHLHPYEYAQILVKSQYGLNVPTQFGPNFRDFEVPGCGAVLLTNNIKHPILEEQEGTEGFDPKIRVSEMEWIGFRDGENCIFYNSPEEAAEIVKTGYNEDISVHGWYFINQKHTYVHRTLDLIKILQEASQ